VVVTLDAVFQGSPYQGYLYSYPHKTSYRPLDPPVPLGEAWANEDAEQLFLYLHLPFCEMRCGFCNLFTTARVQDGMVGAYLQALERQAEVARAALPAGARFVRLAIGGGTPTFLEVEELARLFTLLHRLGLNEAVPTSVESSPETATPSRLRFLADAGVDRVSIGVQSFFPDETRDIARPQKPEQVLAALDVIRSAQIPVLNIDLMYGLPGQTAQTWEASIRQALRFRPEELYLYPLYVRPLTGLGKRGKSWDDQRMELYRQGRDLLRSEGYQQHSMRMFRASWAPDIESLPYRCQEDGMLGLGAGARSYTESLHYCTEYAVGATGVREILDDYLGRSATSFSVADYGIRLDAEERRRRYVILSLLSLSDGLSPADYRRRFGTSVEEDIPQVQALKDAGLLRVEGGRWFLGDHAVSFSDAIGPWLRSPQVVQRMDDYQLR
jgi:oxygen-independent coproporphyrinogen-3 oxidase